MAVVNVLHTLLDRNGNPIKNSNIPRTEHQAVKACDDEGPCAGLHEMLVNPEVSPIRIRPILMSDGTKKPIMMMTIGNGDAWTVNYCPFCGVSQARPY